LLYALSHKAIRPGEHVWFVGDSGVDMMCANAARCFPVAIGDQAYAYGGFKLKVRNRHHLLSVLKDHHAPCHLCESERLES
jgi:phosphoglycolate phosphatase-like HAD superfamily hydrolase